jgi:solute carrier family 6 amino acid transporter-like protein 5/7/9/14
MFCSGLIYITPGGFFILDLVDHFGANFVIYVLAIIEVSAVAYVYGIGKFLKDLEFMLGFPVGIYWRFTWGLCIPVGMTGILVYVFSNEKRWTYNGLDYPDVAIACGWALAGLSLSVFPICAIHTIYTRKASGLKEKFQAAYRPSPRWGPRNPKFRREWVAFHKKNKEITAGRTFLQKMKDML